MNTAVSRIRFGATALASLAVRVAVIALLLIAEKILLDSFVNSEGAQSAMGLGAVVRLAQHWTFRFVVTFAASLALLCYMRSDDNLRRINDSARGIGLRGAWLLLHCVLVLLLIPLSYMLYGRGAYVSFGVTLGVWLCVAAVAVSALFAAFGSWPLWRSCARALGALWLVAAVAGVFAACAIQWSEQLWSPTARVTFGLVSVLLKPIIPSLATDPINLILYSDRFSIRVANACSGLEGIGLMLTFCCAWLLYFRKEYIFPRALWLIPVSLTLIFAFNAVRVAALMFIGYAGFPDVAMYGFHSQAGWIAFNCAACAVAFVSRRIVWINRSASPSVALHEGNPTADYLMPFLSILGAGMLIEAASNGFETLYGLRLAACAIALFFCWRRLRALDWRFGWRAITAGFAVFVLWILASHFLAASRAMPVALSTMAAPQRVLWIAIRVVASIATVPIAEELAYRGYLLRRIVAVEFESVRFEAVGYWPLLLSSVVFGLSHGLLWLPGTAAGLVYGALIMRTGRFGEAVVAHATTNALIAAWVLIAQQWQLWN